jgi:uncharacterized membrane protein YvbJ
MDYCKECGEKMQSEDRFCSACGEPVPSPKPSVALPAAEFLKRYKWWVIGTAAFLAALAGLYMYGKTMTGEDRYIRQFEAALRGGDAARVAFMLHTDTGKVSMNESNAEGIIGYVDNTEGLADRVIQDLKDQASGSKPATFFEWKRDGKQFGIYDRYRIVVRTSSVNAHTNYDGTEIKLNGKTVATADSDDYTATVGPLLPGLYKLQAEYAGEYTTLKTEQEVTVTGSGTEAPVDLSMKGEYVTVDANYSKAAIFIDGRDTGAVAGMQDKLGPVTLDGTNYVHVEKSFPWGIAKSKPVPIDSASIHVEIDPNTDGLKKAVMNTAAEFLQSWIDAYHTLDASAVKHLSKDKMGALVSSVQAYKANGLVYNGRLKKLVFDLDSIYIQQSDGVFRTAVSVQNTYDQAYYAQGETPPEPTEITDTITYNLVIQDGKWIIEDWYQDYNFSNAHTKEMDFPAA